MIAEFPKINIKETINKTSTINRSKVNVCAILPNNSNKVESMMPIAIDNEKTFENIFGVPTSSNYKYWYNIYNFLQYNTNGLYIIKPTNNGDMNYYKAYNTNISNDSSYMNIYNTELAEQILYRNIDDDIRFVNRAVTNTENISIAVCSDSEHFTLPISNEKIENIIDYHNILPIASYGNKYFIKKKELILTKKIDNTHFIYDDNVTDILIDQNIEIDGILYTTVSISSNSYNLVNVTNVSGNDISFNIPIAGMYDYLMVGDVITSDVDEYIISAIDITGSVMTLTLNKTGVEVDDNVQIGINNTTIEVLESYTSTPTHTYYVIGELSSELLNLSDSIYKLVEYETSWSVSDIIDGYYRINTDGTVVSISSGILSTTALSSTELNSDYSVLSVYSGFYIDNEVASFSNIFAREPDWNNGEFLIAIFEKINGLFELKEQYQVKPEESSEYRIFRDSSYIYMITNKVRITTNTNDLSIDDMRIVVNTNIDYSNIEYYSIDTLNDINNILSNTDKYNVEFFMGYEYISDDRKLMNIPCNFSTKNKKSTTIISAWDEDEYLGATKSDMIYKLLSNFGNNTYTNKKITNFSSYISIYNNMKLQQDLFAEGQNLWLPIIGDITGILVENADNPAITGTGFTIKNIIQLLIDSYKYEDNVNFNKNGMNVVGYDVANNAIIKDSITATKDYDSLVREFYIRRITNNIKNHIEKSFYVYLIKLINVDSIIAMTNSIKNYVDGISAIEKSIVEPNIVGDSVTFDIQLWFYNKIRTINFNIIINNNKIEIGE